MAQVILTDEKLDEIVVENVTNWLSGDNPLAPLTDEQIDLIDEVADNLHEDLNKIPLDNQLETDTLLVTINETDTPEINTLNDFIKWMIRVENEIKFENLDKYQIYDEKLKQQMENCKYLVDSANSTTDLIKQLKDMYSKVIAKTDSLHNLSEQIMVHQKLLKEKKQNINEKLHYFLIFNSIHENIEKGNKKINSKEYLELLDTIDNAIKYLGSHMNYKESKIYKIKYESLLTTALNKLYHTVANVLNETTNQLVDPDSNLNLLPLNLNDTTIDSSYTLYYGKFQSAANKIKLILIHLEGKDTNEQYKNILIDCQKSYVAKRLPILSQAVLKGLSELKEKYTKDFSILFRSCCLFIMKVCQDETNCYFYYFDKSSEELHYYLGVLSQHLYDTLRPSLITVNHVEVLCELCGILKREMLNEKVYENKNLKEYISTINQLLQDVEERLVFRTNIFFQHDLLDYSPSPGDLAYPEKLEQMENLTISLHENNELTSSSSSSSSHKGSSISADSQDMSNINTNQQVFRSYTGNSPADLHGMWYPTVKRTLVILSRLYFCLDRETFQGLAQEALLICIRTIKKATTLITTRKSEINGRLFQIKHLLIIREQIAPFQVDFTAREMVLDFSTVSKAAIELMNKRDKLFVLNSNNAILEFLLEGTPKVKEYLVDSRKEIDKELKFSCEALIAYTTNYLIGTLIKWLTKANQLLQDNPQIVLFKQEFGNPKYLSEIIVENLRNIKTKIPDIQKTMQLYLANKETEFILFRPIKNNLINVFIQIENILTTNNYSEEDQLIVACPSPEQINIMICSVSLSGNQDVIIPKSSN